MPDEQRQLAQIAAVLDDTGRLLDRLFINVADLKVILSGGMPAQRDESSQPLSDTTPGTPSPGSWPGLRPEDEVIPAASPPAAGDSGSVLGTDPLATARALQAALEGMTDQLSAVQKTIRRGKRVAIALIISLIIDVGLTAGVSVTAIQASNASAEANATVGQLHAVAKGSCVAGNRTRASEIALWEHLLSLAPPPSTASGRRLDAALITYVRKVFAPRPCAALYRLRQASSLTPGSPSHGGA